MTVELWALVWSAVILFVLILLSANANTSAMGMAWGLGNRDEPATAAGWGARAGRAYRNHLENLLIFACLVLAAHLAGIHTALTVLGAQIFLVARILYAVIYVAGITALALRTIAWFAGVVGYVLIFIAILMNA